MHDAMPDDFDVAGAVDHARRAAPQRLEHRAEGGLAIRRDIALDRRPSGGLHAE